MDTSETYFKMRITAIPDLGMGDGSFALKSPYFVTDNVWVAPNGNFYCKTDDVIGCQLERQDQLQAIIIGEYDTNWYLTWLFGAWCSDLSGKDRDNKSMEQLWLAFVMKEKFNKEWDSEKEEWMPLS